MLTFFIISLCVLSLKMKIMEVLGGRRARAGQCDQGDKVWEGWMEEGSGS